jgi:hypothetical protein
MRSQLKSTIVTCLILLLPMFSFASNSAVLTRMGPNNTNGSTGSESSALFAGDVVATQSNSAATINAEGSMVLVQPDSSVQFQDNAVNMDNGDVLVTTWKGMAVKVGRFTIAPAASGPSKFEVSDSGGVVQIAARQGALNINDGATTSVLAEGLQTTQSEDQGAPPAASGGGVHRSKKKLAAILIGGAAAGATVGIILATRGSSQPVSNATP